MANLHREKLKKHEDRGEVAIEQEYIDGYFWMQPHFMCDKEQVEEIRWLYYCCIEQLKTEFDQRHQPVQGSFFEALKQRKAA